MSHTTALQDMKGEKPDHLTPPRTSLQEVNKRLEHHIGTNQ